MCTSTSRIRRIMNVHLSSVVLRFVSRFVRTCDGVSLSERWGAGVEYHFQEI